MEALGLNEIREKYLQFFEDKQHLRLPSYPLIPHNDKSLLLINSGMAPMKTFFTGQEIPPSKRVTTCQKCIRTGDIENVGKTARHGTFFEMLGNFSFGDYFKEEIIPWAWEFVTEVLEIPKEKLYISVYEKDDESYEIWNKKIGIPEDHLVRLGKDDNFWEVGVGPCGPCSEIYYDKGEKYGCGSPTCSVGCDCDRYMEFWNLVFTQYCKEEDGEYSDLEFPNIDTGMGLERMATIMQDVNSIFDVDTIREILNKVCDIAGVSYNENKKFDESIRLITDHVRSATFMTADGVLPSNEGRGYVLRRLIRRAVRHGKLLDIKDTFMTDLVKTVISVSKSAYPELSEKKDYILKVISMEEEKFNSTIDQGLEMIKSYIKDIKGKFDNEDGNGEKIFLGEEAFRLYDTFGFPLDLLSEILSEYDIKVDVDDFNRQMEEQKNRARQARETSNYMGAESNIYDEIDPGVSTEFLGYDNLEIKGAKILYIVSDDKFVEEATEGMEVAIITDKTCLYAESGGQKGDKGRIETSDAVIEINDVIKVKGNKFIHIGTVVEDSFKVNDTANIFCDKENRLATSRNHTATHLLQSALKNVLGGHVEQAGSSVSNDKLRFDFTHFNGLSNGELEMVESIVNEKIFEALDVQVLVRDIDEAKKMGATALFGEKYSKKVRVVNISDYSLEFCGGTHVKNTSQIGFIKLVGEYGVSSGVRRIEAITGKTAVEYTKEESRQLGYLSSILKVTPEKISSRIEFFMNQAKELNKKLEQLSGSETNNIVEELVKKKDLVNNQILIVANVSDLDQSALLNLSDRIKEKLESCVIVLVSDTENGVNLLATATDDVVKAGAHAGNIIKAMAPIVDGRGGGRPNKAQAAGKDNTKIKEAMAKAKEILSEQLKQ